MEEIWKPVVGYEGLYEVSNLGNIKSLSIKKMARRGYFFTKECLMVQRINYKGYKRIGLTKDKIQKQFSVYRLVAQAFIPNPDNKPCVNHIDGNKLNNTYNNLEWCTQKENVHHAVSTGLMKPVTGVNNVQASLNYEQLLQVRELFLKAVTGKKIAGLFKVSEATISRIRLGQTYK